MPHTRTVLVAALALCAFTACSDDPDPSQEAAPLVTPTPATTTSSSSTTTTMTATPAPPRTASTPTPARPSATKVVLFGDDLGPAKVGDPFRQAVTALTVVLGKPTADPTEDTSCAQSINEVAWGEFRIAEAEDGTVQGWASRSAVIASPSGVRVGTTVAALKRIYGAKLDLVDGPGDFVEFGVKGINFAGSLDGTGSTSKVTSLYNGICGSP